MQKDLMICDLLEVYGTLLTSRQQESLRLYYEEDFSLAEIAELQGISRQGVNEAIRAGREMLHHYEDKLALLNKKKELENCLACMEAMAPADHSDLAKAMQKLKECIHGI